MRINRKRTPKTRRRSSTFFPALILSALAVFSASLYALAPELRQYFNLQVMYDSVVQRIEPWLVEQDRRFNAGNNERPVQADGYVQTRFAQCQQFFVPGEMPAVPITSDATAMRELCYTSFAILHNGTSKTPVFVAQRLNRSMLEQAQKVGRTDRFYEEARLPARERAQLSDYRGSGYSRGHMAPAADMNTDQAMSQSFSLANMVPQDQRHNGGAWAQIEQDTRKYIVRAKGDVYVFTGPVYDGSPQVIGAGKVSVPVFLYKVVYDPETKRAWVHWHANRADTRANRPITYEEFVQRTGLHLLPKTALKLH